MNKILDVRKLPNYAQLRNECKKIRDTTAKEALRLTILARFRLGKTILKYQDEGLIESKYGDAVIKALSQDLKFSTSVIYRSISCAAHFGSEKALDEYSRGYEKQNDKPLTWTEIRDNVLPQPKDDPDNHGGVEEVAQHIMSLTEKLGHELEGLKELSQKASVETKEEIAGVISKVHEVIAEPTFLPSAIIDRDADYLDYIRSRPCAVCGKEAEAHHVEGGGVALKGSDYFTIPLCRQHHTEYHDNGRVWFQRSNHIDVFYVTALCLAEYLSAIIVN